MGRETIQGLEQTGIGAGWPDDPYGRAYCGRLAGLPIRGRLPWLPIRSRLGWPTIRGRLGWLTIALIASACGGGGGGSTPAGVVVSGRVTFDLVPAVAGLGLDYAGTETRPARGIGVEIVEGGTVLASTTADDDGDYSLTVTPNRTAFVRAKAEMRRSGAPGWDVRVVDNTNDDALYALDGPTFNTGTSASTRNLHAASGWTGAGYTEPRAAAPFAILDTIRDGIDYVLEADPVLAFAPLVVHWSPDNIPTEGAMGGPDPETGEIVTTFYSSSLGGVFVLGAEDDDTDEYDRHVILHEWGHYLEESLWRNDSVGGAHAPGDRLDMRVAFSEGWGNAFSALATRDSVYRDTLDAQQSAAPAFDVEGPLPGQQNPNPGWFSEQSIQEILYDLVDLDADGADALAMDFAALYAVFRNELAGSVALTSVFPFVNALRVANPADDLLIDAIVTDQAIDPILDDYGSMETNDAGTVAGDVLPIYTPIAVNAGPVNLCSTDEFESALSGMENKLASRRFLRFSLAAPADVTITATTTSLPPGAVADPDLVLHQRGVVRISEEFSGSACTSAAPENCIETFTESLSAGDYVLEVYEYSNTLANDDDPPPIGRTCFDVTVTQ